jgi:porin
VQKGPIASFGSLALAAFSAAMLSVAFAAPKDESAAEWLPQEWKAMHSALEQRGIEITAGYNGDIITNASGGMRRGSIHFGRFDLGADFDFEQLFGWNDAQGRISSLHFYGQGHGRHYMGGLATVSAIEALPQSRLYEAWFEQNFLQDRLSLRLGQQAADVEFFDSKTDDLFINATFGWPTAMSGNLPSGGPSPPIAGLGARLRASLSENITASAAIFNGDAVGPGAGDPQFRDRQGTAFRLRDDPFLIGQVRYDFTNRIGGDDLPGSITPGGWIHAGTFDDRRFTAEGRSQADPLGSQIAAKLRGNRGVFLSVEQTLVKPNDAIAKNEDANGKGITVFARAAYSPPDRNLIDFYADAGIGFNNVLHARPNDRFGFAVAYMHISKNVRQLDRDAQLFSGFATPLHDYEALFEATYEAHIRDGLLLQPFVQYIMHPGGGAANPLDPSGTTRIGNALIFGLNMTLRYY